MNRWLALRKARQARELREQSGLDISQLEVSPEEDTDRIEAELPLIEMLRDALEAGFQACSPEHFVLLHLKHMDGLHLEELAFMFGSNTSTIDRHIRGASRSVRDATMQRIKELDGWLEPKWRDFVDLCRVASPACLGLD
jgi:DNA-directed RNA polymerase specialized sigma24 family protein